MINLIRELLYEKGYQDYLQKGIFVRESKEIVYVVLLSYYDKTIPINRYNLVKNEIMLTSESEFHKTIKVLHLLITENDTFDEHLMEIVNQTENIWVLSLESKRIFIFENQSEKFDHLFDSLDKSLKNETQREKNQYKQFFKPVNTCIVFLNISYFIYLLLSHSYMVFQDTETMLTLGAISYDTFMNGKWYQIVTSLFVHFGLSHLLNNMILLFYVGNKLEEVIGSVSYFFVYFLSGICGNILSLWYYHHINEMVVSAGASGAIFGVIGALFILLIISRKRMENITPNRLFGMIVLTIYYGMTTMGVDNAAHIGGLLAGVISGFVLSKILQYGKLK